MEASLIELFGAATASDRTEDDRTEDDATRRRILDAALTEAASSGIGRLTVEDVVRRSRLGRMTVYRRFRSRDDLVRALVLREAQRFLDAVAAGIERAPDPQGSVSEAFIAGVTFVRQHPLGRRFAETEPGAVIDIAAAHDGAVLSMGSDFIARRIHGDPTGEPSRETRWVADVLARLFLTYVSIPPGDPDPANDTELRRFAGEVITPMIERVAPSRTALGD